MSDNPMVLLVEDSRFFGSMIKRRIETELEIPVDWRPTYAEAVEAIEHGRDDYLVALLDLTLPDAPDGEIVHYALKRSVPSVIFTGGFNNRLRSQFLTWNIVDYILKDSNASMDMLLDTIKRLQKNRSIKVLAVDDSKGLRDTVVKLLEAQLYQVYQAANGVEALRVLEDNPEIMLVVTDYDMPEMDGFELIRTLREKHTKNELAIIGMSASGDPMLSARLIKSGANDFVPKPFQVEEFRCRVGHAVEMLENIALIRDLSYVDPLTRLYNRRYFFESCGEFINRAEQRGLALCVAMMDIDHFKSVNDTYGHDGGDIVLQTVATIIGDYFDTDAIVARFGGEEFCVLTAHPNSVDILAVFDELRRRIEAAPSVCGGKTVNVTMSMGVCCEPDTIDHMLKLADSRLYTAKETGRNRVVAAPLDANVRS